ncbi:MAG TPA: hypothetical protein VKP65_14610 [Rhodothermales bacterium]|nr:hypothetical protein [Rhodothermales bacterium]
MQRLVFAALLLVAVGCQPSPPSDTTDTAADSVATLTSQAALLTDKVWVNADTSGLPGVMQIFLSDGTLLMDSCWETYRLTQWQVSADTLRWQEDTAEIQAQILELTETSLRLRLPLRADTLEQVFRVAEVPYLCPEMEV